jgi:hypothetical protein
VRAPHPQSDDVQLDLALLVLLVLLSSLQGLAQLTKQQSLLIQHPLLLGHQRQHQLLQLLLLLEQLLAASWCYSLPPQ